MIVNRWEWRLTEFLPNCYTWSVSVETVNGNYFFRESPDHKPHAKALRNVKAACRRLCKRVEGLK